MFTFTHPYAFLLLVPLGWTAWRIYRRHQRRGLLFAPVARVAAAGRTWRTAAATVLPLLLLAGAALMIVALARPRTVLSRMRRTSDAIAIEMVVDVSGSMKALDLSKEPDYRTRLDAVKETFAQFVEQRPDDLIGLVSFGGYATTRAPLTIDHRALQHVLEDVEIPEPARDDNGRIVDGEELMTAVGDALATAAARLEKADPKSRIIVLLSDGESNTGVIQPEAAMAAASDLGIKVYTIGVGSNGRAPYMARDMFGRETIAWEDVTLDEALLRKIAETTGGRYFNVRNPDGLEAAMAEIDKLEKTEVESNVYYRYNELFARFLFAGLALVVAGAGLNMAVARRIA